MFKPGDPRPPNSGRKKGKPNKKTEALHELLLASGLEPVENLKRLLPTLEPEKQADVYLKLLEFIYPKRKAVEITIEDIPDEVFEKEAERRLKLVQSSGAILTIGPKK